METNVTSLIDFATAENILLLGAHPDDIELGVGGTIARLLEESPARQVHWVVFSGRDTKREAEAKAGAETFCGCADQLRFDIHDYRDAFMPSQIDEIKRTFEDLKQRTAPDLIFTHHRQDLHQDHRVLAELTWNTWRHHTILEYEILKWDGDLGNPNVYVPLSDAVVEDKVTSIHRIFESQGDRHWFEPEAFRSLMRVRGVECNARYAEAFYARKLRA